MSFFLNQEERVLSANYSEWSNSDIIFWLSSKINLGKYSKAFEEMAVDGDMIEYITEKDLELDFKVNVRLHRIKIMKHIN